MKRPFLILLFCMLFVAILSISIFAEEGGNIAPDATLTTDSKHWHVVGNGGWAKDCIPYLVDGNYETGVPSTCQLAWDNHHFVYDQPVQVGRVVLYVNGSGVRGNIDTVHNVNIDTEYYVVLYDANGKEISFTSQKAKDKTELVFEYSTPMEVKHVKVAYFANYSTETAYLREVEIYSHICMFNELKEEIKAPTCIENGTGLFACSCGKTEEQPLLATGIHEYTDLEALVYENGFLANGIKTLGCVTCEDYVEEEKLPIFKFLGYSISRNGKSICTSYVVENELLSEYELANEITLDYGMLCAVTDATNILNSDGTVIDGINAQAKSLHEASYPRFDIRITASDWTKIADTPLVMCAYIIENNNISYICSDANTENAIPFSYNQINLMPVA